VGPGRLENGHPSRSLSKRLRVHSAVFGICDRFQTSGHGCGLHVGGGIVYIPPVEDGEGSVSSIPSDIETFLQHPLTYDFREYQGLAQ